MNQTDNEKESIIILSRPEESRNVGSVCRAMKNMDIHKLRIVGRKEDYDEEKVADTYAKWRAAQRGTALHAFASQCILLGQKLPRSEKTLNMYVNDAIGYKMQSEQILFYSENCYGTADAISFRKNMLRIHDLKTGKVPAHMEQLLVYAALFCLEYKVKPGDIQIELRLYQDDQIIYHEPEADEIAPIIDKIVSFDKIIRHMKEQEA